MRTNPFNVMLGGRFHSSEWSRKSNSRSDMVKRWSAWSLKYWARRGTSILGFGIGDRIGDSHLLGIYTKQVAVGVVSFKKGVSREPRYIYLGSRDSLN